jgi:hypothetical protein
MIRNRKIYVCDKCKKEITGEVFDIAFGVYNSLDEVEDWDGNEFHLCESCVTGILNSIDNYDKNPFKESTCSFTGKFIPNSGIVTSPFKENEPFTITFSGNKVPSGTKKDIWKEIELPELTEKDMNVELPYGIEKNQKKAYNLADLLVEKSKPPKSKEEQEIGELSKAVSNLNDKLTEFSKVVVPPPSKKNTTEGLVGRSLADKLITSISDVSFGEIWMPGALDRRLEAIEKSLTPQEIDYLRKLDAEGELTNFFGQVFEDAIKKA